MAIRAQQVRLGAVPRRWGDLRLAPWPWRPPPLAQAVPGRAGPSSSCDRARGPGRRRTAAGRSAARARVAAAARAAAAAGGAAACSRLEPPPHACPHHPQAATATVLPTAVRLLEDINYKVRAWAGPCLRWPRHGAGSRAQAAAAARAGAAAWFSTCQMAARRRSSCLPASSSSRLLVAVNSNACQQSLTLTRFLTLCANPGHVRVAPARRHRRGVPLVPPRAAAVVPGRRRARDGARGPRARGRGARRPAAQERRALCDAPRRGGRPAMLAAAAACVQQRLACSSSLQQASARALEDQQQQQRCLQASQRHPPKPGAPATHSLLNA